VLGREHDFGQLDGRSQQLAVGGEVHEPGSELVADPEGAVRHLDQGLGIRVSARQQALGIALVRDAPGKELRGIGQLDHALERVARIRARAGAGTQLE
jgi:hypothetical protein